MMPAQMLKEAPTNFHEAKSELMTEDTLPSEYEPNTEKKLDSVKLNRRKNKAALVEELKEDL